MVEKIDIKLKECCLTCGHFDPNGIKGLTYPIACCGEIERVIACGHMDVCKIYLDEDKRQKGRLRWKRAYLPDFGMQTVYICPKCYGLCASEQENCPHCGITLSKHGEKA